MIKEFNVTGLCIPEKHYMVNIDNKLEEVRKMIDAGLYFTINRPRQFGKTTTLFLLENKLKKYEEYLVISMSFEGLGKESFKSEKKFIKAFFRQLKRILMFLDESELLNFLEEEKDIYTLDKFGDFITYFIKKANKKVILIIDEVDQSSNNELFISFLGLLRNKYLLREQNRDYTFHSVILSGVHDVKNLKMKIRNDDEEKYNSPWNIASEFNIDMSFSVEEISTMFRQYSIQNNVNIDEIISEKIYFYTSGYPFLVSKLCKIIDEIIIGDGKKEWAVSYVDEAVKILLKEDNTNFQSLIKNLENNKELYNFIKRIVVDGENISYVITDNIISQGTIYGIFKQEKGICKIQNRIYEQLIYNHMTMKILREEKVQRVSNYNFRENFINEDEA